MAGWTAVCFADHGITTWLNTIIMLLSKFHRQAAISKVVSDNNDSWDRRWWVEYDVSHEKPIRRSWALFLNRFSKDSLLHIHSPVQIVCNTQDGLPVASIVARLGQGGQRLVWYGLFHLEYRRRLTTLWCGLEYSRVFPGASDHFINDECLEGEGILAPKGIKGNISPASWHWVLRLRNSIWRSHGASGTKF